MALATPPFRRTPSSAHPADGFVVCPRLTVARLLLCSAALVLCLADGRPVNQAVYAAEGPAVEPTLNAKLETLSLHSGETFQGWIESENKTHISFKVLERPVVGEPQLKSQRFLVKNVDKVERLEREARATAKKATEQWLRDLRRAKVLAAAKAKKTPAELFALDKSKKLGPATWEYQGQHFEILSTADEATVRAVAIRMEQRWAALSLLFPSTREPEKRLKVVIWGSTAEYEAQLRSLGASLSHRAFFAPADHLIVARTDMGRVAQEVERIKQEHAAVLADFKRQVEELRDAQKQEQKLLASRGASDREIAEYQRLRGKQVRDEQHLIAERIAASEKRNDELLVELADRTFRELYHEVFHAYLESCVFPQGQYDVPAWLNEGLAQVFETARIVSGRLASEASPARREAAERLAADLLGPSPMRLADLLRAGPDKFLHTAPLGLAKDRRAAADAARHYLYAWGLADFLTYRKNAISTDALGEYVTPGEKDPLAPIKRFEELMKRPLGEVEEEWIEYIRTLAEPPRDG